MQPDNVILLKTYYNLSLYQRTKTLQVHILVAHSPTALQAQLQSHHTQMSPFNAQTLKYI